MPLKDLFSKPFRKRDQGDAAQDSKSRQGSREPTLDHKETDRQKIDRRIEQPSRADKPVVSGTRSKDPGISARQSDIDRRVRRAAQSVLENESLTDDLDDKAAKALIDWGVSRAENAARATENLDDERAEEQMYPRMRANRKLMRTVNKLLARRSALSAEDQAGMLDDIAAQAALVYDNPEVHANSSVLQHSLAQAVAPDVEPEVAVRRLRGIFESQADPSNDPAPPVNPSEPESLDPPGGSMSGDLKIT